MTEREGWSLFDPLRQTFWFEVPGDTWTIAYRLLARPGGRIALTELRMYPTDPPGGYDADPGEWSGDPDVVPEKGLTARAVREYVKPGSHRDHAREALKAMQERMGASAFERFMDQWSVDPSTMEKLTTKRQPSPDRELWLAQIASFYVRRNQMGSRRPTAEVAKKFEIVRTKARDEIHEARRRGLLTKTTKGVAGGQLTPRAETLLNENEETT